ncbi:hypothetical protein [Sphingomonas sp.]|uniref:hypothetical protein n=1 Tax=Sphingomonas sp. TaxID=28214 RepID=UPI0025F2F456|nr:hypothetical protein [Sphingomonas sp.]
MARRQALEKAITGLLREYLAGRVLAFDDDAPDHYANIAAARRESGQSISQIAAIARLRGARLATRKRSRLHRLRS